MTERDIDLDLARDPVNVPANPALFGRRGPTDAWIASHYDDVRTVLADDRFEVPQAPPCDAVGTIAWLRASVSRFENGPEHGRRRAQAVTELRNLAPERLRSAAIGRARTALAGLGHSGDRVELMDPLARRVPMATMAAALELIDPESAATAVIASAAGYLFAPSDPEIQCLADAATARLLDMFMPSEMDVAVARMSLLLQGCDATAGLVGTTLHVLQNAEDARTLWTTDEVMAEVLRHSPTLLITRRVARTDLDIEGCNVATGDVVLCRVDTANRDPAVFKHPERFDPSRQEPPSLTFGHGIRPCPAAPQALALAAGVVDAVREHCSFISGQHIDYEPSVALRVPRRLEVLLV